MRDLIAQTRENKLAETKQIDLNKTLQKLAVVASESVEAYVANADDIKTITDTMLQTLADPETTKHMEPRDMIALVKMTTDLQTKPLEQYTKLFTQMNQFQEKLNMNKEIERLQKITEEITKAKEEANTINNDDITSTAGLENLIIE